MHKLSYWYLLPPLADVSFCTINLIKWTLLADIWVLVSLLVPSMYSRFDLEPFVLRGFIPTLLLLSLCPSFAIATYFSLIFSAYHSSFTRKRFWVGEMPFRIICFISNRPNIWQVSTRFLSASPPLYWFAAHLMASPVNRKRWGYLIWAYSAAYILLGSLLFSNFYPFTWETEYPVILPFALITNILATLSCCGPWMSKLAC